MMIIFLVPLLFLGLGVFLVKKYETEDWRWILGLLLGAVSVIFLLVFVAMVPSQRMNDRANMARFQSFRETLERARAKGEATEIERAAIQKSVASWNAWIASRRYWNSTVWDWCYVDEAAELEPLE